MNTPSHHPYSHNLRFRIGFWVLVAIALFYLLTEHRAHVLGVLPYLFLLACPLMHFFMHGGHGHHHHGTEHDNGSTGEKRKEK